MVGTAVYQVGLHVLHPAKEIQGIEARRAEKLAAARERREQTGDQPVDVEQRHDVQAAIGVGKLKRRGDVLRRGGNIGLRERHDLRPRVVPKVCRISATSSASPIAGTRGGFFSPPESVKTPAPTLGSGVKVKTAMPSFCATSIAGDLLPASTTSALAPRSLI